MRGFTELTFGSGDAGVLLTSTAVLIGTGVVLSVLADGRFDADEAKVSF